MFPMYLIDTKRNFDKVGKEWIQLPSLNWVISKNWGLSLTR